MQLYKANKTQELFDRAHKKRFEAIGPSEEILGSRVFAETNDTIYFMFSNDKIIIKQSEYKTGNDLRDRLTLYENLCELLLDVINEIE